MYDSIKFDRVFGPVLEYPIFSKRYNSNYRNSIAAEIPRKCLRIPGSYE